MNFLDIYISLVVFHHLYLCRVCLLVIVELKARAAIIVYL